MNFQDTLLAQGDLIKKLKQRNYNLVVENEFLKEKCSYWKKEHDELFETIEQIKKQRNNCEKLFYESVEENQQLKEQADNLSQDLQNRCERCIELNDENEQHKQKKSELVHENVKLQNDLFTQELNEDEADYLISKLKKEIVELKTEIVDHRVKEYRLTKILNETSDCT